MIQDIRYAFRRIARHPGFTTVVVISLALGIGANTMIFSLVNGMLLRALPYPEADRVMMLWFTPPGHPEQRQLATHLNCDALRLRPTQSFEHIGCMVNGTGSNMSEDGRDAATAERLTGQEYTADMAQALGTKPIVGRWFTADENEPGRGPVLLVSYNLWQRRFAGSTDVVGRRVHVTFTQSAGNDLGTIIGVLPEHYEFMNPRIDYVFAFVLPTGAANSPTRRFTVAGRLKPGVTVAQAQAEMDGIASGLAQEFPRTNKDWKIQVQPVQQAYVGGALKSAANVLEGVVAFVLLIACANVAGLLLAQGSAEHKELAIRAALGSGRGRLVRQLLTSSVVLSLLGGVAGLAIGWAGMRVLVSSLPTAFPRLNEISIDGTVLAFTLVLSVVTGLVFGIIPAIQVSRPDVMDALRDSTRTTAGAARQRLRSSFVVVQIALALVLLIGAGLFINSFLKLYTVQTGLDPGHLMSFQVQFMGDKYIRDTGRPTTTGSPETEISQQLFDEIRQVAQHLAAIPGVQSATAETANAPLSGGAARFPFVIQGREVSQANAEAQGAEWYPVGANYFATVNQKIVRGRDFTEQDNRSGLAVVAINQTMAKRYWPNEDPLGRQIQIGYLSDPARQIVAIVADVRQNSRQTDMQPQMYFPMSQLPQFTAKVLSYGLDATTFIVRTSGNPEQVGSALRAAVNDVDRSQPVYNMRTIQWYLSNQLEGYRQYVMMLGAFGGIAVILALVGIYGIMAHSVTQRTAEIGIRMALGASAGQVLGLILRRGIVLIVAGLAIGFAASLGLTRLIRSSLWGVTATDPLTFALVVVSLAAIALIACYLPARRALAVNPVVALRYE